MSGDFVVIGTTDDEALQHVIKTAHVQGQLVKGLNSCLRSLERKEVDLCILADNCEVQKYKDVVKALCKEKKIKMINHENNMKLGEMVGQCKFDNQSNARKIVSCSVVGIQTVIIVRLPMLNYLQSIPGYCEYMSMLGTFKTIGDFVVIGTTDDEALQHVIKTAHVEGQLVKGLNSYLRS
ncbi:40S ribosomal protein S12 [Intoshia linei]|uniref:40S ribosomal protein S12 n=1 Tax=Intoshia linei TaxID=1819745 RepID=A0A177B758_9BILA|nr:40S ribosomal protein S12 [Intoshia linei]